MICHWCRAPVTEKPGNWESATRDHLTPKSRGGSDEANNIVIACYRCNQLRGPMPVSQFLEAVDPLRLPPPTGPIANVYPPEIHAMRIWRAAQRQGRPMRRNTKWPWLLTPPMLPALAGEEKPHDF